MAKFTLNRRSVLRGAGGIAIALPWLEIMKPSRAEAQTAVPAKRFVGVYTPGGTVIAKWKPTVGTETSFTLSPILAPLAPVQNKLIVVDGLDMKSAIGEQHQAGICALLTGTAQSTPLSSASYALGPSIDQVLAGRLSVGKKKASLPIALRWATGKSHGLLHPINSMNFEAAAPYRPIPPRLDPQEIFTDLFGTLMPTNEGAARIERKKSILDYLGRRYTALSARVGTADRQKIDEHLTKIRDIEVRVKTMAVPPAVCRAPTRVETTDYNPIAGRSADDNGAIKDTSTDAAIPKVGKLMMDMIVMALSCDLTGVATMQWSDTEAKHTFPWLNLSEHHHYYQHDGGFKPVECEKICTWYTQQHLYLLQEMAKVDMGGHTLLDESVVFIGSELSEPPTHKKLDMPFLLAGGGGMRTGRWLKYNHLSHNNLLVSILNLFGDTRTTFGDRAYSTGPLTAPTIT